MKSKKLSFLLLAVFFVQYMFVTSVNAETYKPEVVFKTSKGSITLKLDPLKAPRTVENFLKYVDEEFYDNTLFHRAIPGFVVQAGGYEKGMKLKKPHAAVKSESANRLKNSRGTISMARRMHPDTATSQFYINLADNASLDYKGKLQPGYTVFGSVSEGMDVIDKISEIETHMIEKFNDVPKEDVFILSAKRKQAQTAYVTENKVRAEPNDMERYIAGEHYTVLDNPVSTRNSKKIEVVEMFSYGCPHCYEFDPQFKQWETQQSDEIDSWSFPAVWNKPMKFFARAFYTAEKLNVLSEIHNPLFNAVVIKQKKLSTEEELSEFFAAYGVNKKRFSESFNSDGVIQQAQQAEARVKNYKPVGVPEIVVNGKYRIDRMRAGGMKEMLAIADFLVNKERDLLKK